MENKTHVIHVRISPKEEDVIQMKAKRLGLSLGQYMRWISIEADVEVNLKGVKDGK